MLLAVWGDLSLQEGSLRGTFAKALRQAALWLGILAPVWAFLWLLAKVSVLFLLLAFIALFFWFGRGYPRRQIGPQSYTGQTRKNVEVPVVVRVVELGSQIVLGFGVLVLFVVPDELPSLLSYLILTVLLVARFWLRFFCFLFLRKSDSNLAEVAYYNPVDGFFSKRQG